MAQNRWYPTNTSLADGQVLVSGGYRFYELLTWGGRDSVSATSVKNDIHANLGMRGPVEVTTTTVTDTLPTARVFHGGVFCNVAGGTTGFTDYQRMVIYGGTNSSGATLDDLWSLTRDGSSNWVWTRNYPDTPGGSPGARSKFSMVYDDSAKCVWIFGLPRFS